MSQFGHWDIGVKSGPLVERETKMADKLMFFQSSLFNRVITVFVAALGIAVWDLLPGAAIVIMLGLAIAWSVERLARGSFIIASRLVSAELGLAISGIVIVTVAMAH
jgi:hypothetical protein